MPKISFNLSKESINRARVKIQEVLKAQENEEYTEEYINDVLEQAKIYAIEKLNDMRIYGDTEYSALTETLTIQKYNSFTKSAALRVGEVGVYVEFGTGIKGKQSPHGLMSSMSYDVNGHGEAGWWYPTDESDPNPHKWTDPNGVLRAWTQGMPSRPFMYETMLWLQKKLGKKYTVTFVVR